MSSVSTLNQTRDYRASRRSRRSFRSLLAIFFTSSVLAPALVMSTAGEAAAFYPDPSAVQYLVYGAAGTAATTGGTATLVTGGAVVVGSAAVGTAAFYGTTKVLHWIFDDPEVGTEAPTPSSSTSISNVCSGYLRNGTADCPTEAGPDGYQFSAYNIGVIVLQGAGYDNNTQNAVVRVYSLDGSPFPSGTYVNAYCTTAGVQVYGGFAGSASGTQEQLGNGTISSADVTINMVTAVNSCHANGAYASMFSVTRGFVGVWDAMFPATIPPSNISIPAPPHKWRVQTSCPGGTVLTTYSELFYEADETLPPIVPSACPEGLPTGLQVYEGTSDGSGGTQRIGWTAPSTNPYPECLPGGVQAPCVNSLWLVTSTGTKLNCAGATVDCTSYVGTTVADPNYECRWGTYVVADTDCAPLEALQQTPTAVDAGTDTGANPDPSDGTNCITSSWSWNPVSWVYAPVKCALKWAFVPSAEAATSWQTKINTIKTQFPVNIMVGGYNAIVDIIGAVNTTSPAACDFAFHTAQGVSFDPICNAASTMQSNTKGQAIYRLMQIGMIGAFGWWTLRRIAASFGGKESTDS